MTMNADQLIKTGIIADLTVEKKAGEFERELPKAGKALCRFVDYIETGKHKKKNKYGEKVVDEARFTFELVTPQHQIEFERDGEVVRMPHKMYLTLPISTSSKSNYIKLFKAMNYKGDKKHFLQMLGEGFMCEISHNKTEKATFANLTKDGMYTLSAPRIEDPMTGGVTDISVPPATSPLRFFLWNLPADKMKPVWDNLFIDGTREVDGKSVSKNWIQELMLSAENFQGSELDTCLNGGEELSDLPNMGTSVDSLHGIA